MPSQFHNQPQNNPQIQLFTPVLIQAAVWPQSAQRGANPSFHVSLLSAPRLITHPSSLLPTSPPKHTHIYSRGMTDAPAAPDVDVCQTGLTHITPEGLPHTLSSLPAPLVPRHHFQFYILSPMNVQTQKVLMNKHREIEH